MGFKLAGTTALWTYTLEDGFCDDSRALDTARAYQLPSEIVDRAAELIDIFPNACRETSETEWQKNNLHIKSTSKPSNISDTPFIIQNMDGHHVRDSIHTPASGKRRSTSAVDEDRARRIENVVQDKRSSVDISAKGKQMNIESIVEEKARIADTAVVGEVSFEQMLQG